MDTHAQVVLCHLATVYIYQLAIYLIILIARITNAPLPKQQIVINITVILKTNHFEKAGFKGFPISCPVTVLLKVFLHSLAIFPRHTFHFLIFCTFSCLSRVLPNHGVFGLAQFQHFSLHLFLQKKNFSLDLILSGSTFCLFLPKSDGTRKPACQDLHQSQEVNCTTHHLSAVVGAVLHSGVACRFFMSARR